MVRRTKTEAAATREALLDAAERVFRDKGVAHTSLAEVAEAAGLTRGAVYWHFRDKGDLFDALCGRVTLPMEAMLANAGGTRQQDPLASLRTLAVRGLTQLATDARAQAVFDVVFHKCEFTADLAAVAERQRATDRGCLLNVERLLKQAVALEQLPLDTDTAMAATALNSFVVGVMHQWVQDPGRYDLAKAAPGIVDMFVAGLRVCPPRRSATPGRKPTSRKSRAASSA